MYGQQEHMIANALYSCREQAILLQGEDSFREEVEKWKPIFQEVMDENECSELVALSELLDRVEEVDKEGFLSNLLCAVGCELAEPLLVESILCA